VGIITQELIGNVGAETTEEELREWPKANEPS
jgi:hypothetical protein